MLFRKEIQYISVNKSAGFTVYRYISVGYDITKSITFTVEANNVLDVLPDLQIYKKSYYGVFKYVPVQMGTPGSYFFGRLNFNF